VHQCVTTHHPRHNPKTMKETRMAKLKTALYDVIELYNKGYSVYEIARLTGFTKQTVKYLLKENGVPEAW